MVIGIIIVALIIIIAIWYFTTYNSLISLRNKKDTEWSQIDVQLKRRSDLIPNLVETVKGYAKHESETLEAVISARNSFVTAETPEQEMKASGEISQALSKLFALSENYPDLKANQNFISLQNDLKETEDKISYARQFYNDAVLTYNNKVEKGTFFEVTETEKVAPQVKF